jgi:ABC-type multidrug transport system fused ATPase/permease subunit
VEDAGANFSVGQRQLLCLARAALRGTRVLLMDEATANVDEGTDEQISTALRTAFPAATVITVAHRLATVIDYDFVCVLSEGRVAEFGAPHDLLREGAALAPGMASHGGRGALFLLAHSAGEAAGAALTATAAEAAARRKGGALG